MAVIDEVPGLQATVRVNGQDLEEYDNPHPDEAENEAQFVAKVNNGNRSVAVDAKHIPSVRKYIEAKSGDNFEMAFVKLATYQHTCDHIAVQYKVDEIPTDISHEPRELMKHRWEDRFDQIYTTVSSSKALVQSLIFGDINIDSSNERTVKKIHQDIIKAKSLGILKVYVYEMKDTQEIREDYVTDICDTEDTEIAEKATKGRNLTNAVKFGEPEEFKPPSDQPEDVFVDPQKRPFAIFEFIYMSRDGLIKEGILPQPLPFDNMDLEELRRWAREQYIKERDLSVKDEKNSTIIKKEEHQELQSSLKRGPGDTETPTPKRYKESRRDDGKVEIDLLD
ncbi:hypothetical protein F5X96DRAFT_682104 [Biscogniauxia mediterranea]|nr:hypothetical protein F5X96DRAFT_682104 [Biscogniauxia mediterranea]